MTRNEYDVVYHIYKKKATDFHSCMIWDLKKAVFTLNKFSCKIFFMKSNCGNSNVQKVLRLRFYAVGESIAIRSIIL